jgi:hypothetical protein
MKQEFKRKKWFEVEKKILRIFIRKPKVIYLGEKITPNSLVLSNHEGSHSPVKLELYFPYYFHFWGTHEMNENFKNRYHYLATTYFHNKKHIPYGISHLVALVALPFSSLFYRGSKLISTYEDGRMLNTIKTSMKALEQGENIIIFPEDSSTGYFKELKAFHPGFYSLVEKCVKKNIQKDLFILYYNVKKNRIIVSRKYSFDEVLLLGKNKNNASEYFKNVMNEISKY